MQSSTSIGKMLGECKIAAVSVLPDSDQEFPGLGSLFGPVHGELAQSPQLLLSRLRRYGAFGCADHHLLHVLAEHILGRIDARDGGLKFAIHH